MNNCTLLSTPMMLLCSGILLATAAAAVSAAQDVYRRDFALIQEALNNVNSLLQVVDTAITALSASNIATSGPQLIQLGQGIGPSLEGVLAQIQSSQVLTLDETNGLNTARSALNHNVNLTVGDLIRQKPIFDMVPGLSDQVAPGIQQIRAGTSVLFQAVSSKLDPAAPDSTNIFAATLAVFDMAITAFGGQAASGPTAAANPAVARAAIVGLGMVAADGSCNCALTCPAGQSSLRLL